jgi:4a-hydroxytetrahydrobiopterin dehydratase
MPLLNEGDIQRAMEELDGWSKSGNEIVKHFEFDDFIHAMGFVNSVALLAERVNHHPDVDIRWNKVTLTLATHSEGGITKKDIALAKEIETL